MDYHNRPKRRASAGLRWKPPKCSLFMALVVVAAAAGAIGPATSQHHSVQNSPPVLYVPDRNWRISETEPVGQIIARIRAEDAENDELEFGLEPHFSSSNGGGDEGGGLPFRIDPVGGVVYLNESLAGRGGENFFLYITVSDGQLTAKNEVFVNILGRGAGHRGPGSRAGPPSITSVVQNISQFLPAFESLPGVQSIRNQLPNRRPSNSLPPGFGINPPIFTPHRPGQGAGLNFNPVQQLPIWPTKSDADADADADPDSDEGENDVEPPATTSRTRLTPISVWKEHNNNNNNNKNKDSASSSNRFNNSTPPASTAGGPEEDLVGGPPAATSPTAAYSFRATVIPVVIVICGLFVAAVAIFGFLYRKHLCSISKTLKKKSKEEMAKKSNQSNLSSNLTDDSRNSMVLQHWDGPTAYGNRYVPWERDQQMIQQSMATSQLSTGVVSGAALPGDAPGGPAAGVGASVGGGGGAGVPNGGSGGNAPSKYDRWEFPRHRLKFFNILGEGAFGQVWRCEATDIDGVDGVTTVAVKTLKENAAEVEKNDLVSELQVMKSLEPHVNVVRLLGCCTDKDPLFVIIEYVNRGKLQTYLRNSRAERHYGNTHGKSNVLTSGDLTSFMYQVAKGMDYLTSRGIIHRDLAARNILISDDHTCKVADFGFARDVVTSKIYERKSEGKLPIRWMAIESLYDNIFSVKSDIWSFGILMWEIVTLGSTPYPGVSAADVMRKVRDGYRLEKPDHCRRELYNIMYYCWSSDANERPTFSEVVHMLDKLLHTEMDYIELERFPDHNYYNILNLSGEKL